MDSVSILLFIFMLGSGLYLTIKGLIGCVSDISLHREKMYTVGKILDIEEHKSSDSDGNTSSSSYKTLVQTTLGEENFTGYVWLSSSDIINYTVGSEINVIYQRSNPENIRYEDSKLFISNIACFIAGIFFLVLTFNLPYWNN